MARPIKSGLDYFPHDVGLFADRKFRPLRKRYGYLAPMVYVVLLELIYSDKGYYLDYSDSESVLLDIEERLSGKYQPETETLETLICDLVAQGLLSHDHFERQILTSKRIQVSYYKATVDRKEVFVDPDIWILDAEEMLKHSKRHPLLNSMGISVPDGVNRSNNSDNRSNNSVNRSNNPQSKAKQSKAEQSKAEESNMPGSAGLCAPASASESVDEYETLLALIRDNICPITSQIRCDIADWLRHMEPACVQYAIQEAARSGAKTTKYIYSILQRLLDQNITSADRLDNQTYRKEPSGKLAFEEDNSTYANYFDGEDLYGGEL